MQLSYPTRLLDVSDFRPIPDNQEVLADADTDESLIVEIVVSHPSFGPHLGQTKGFIFLCQNIISSVSLRTNFLF